MLDDDLDDELLSELRSLPIPPEDDVEDDLEAVPEDDPANPPLPVLTDALRSDPIPPEDDVDVDLDVDPANPEDGLDVVPVDDLEDGPIDDPMNPLEAGFEAALRSLPMPPTEEVDVDLDDAPHDPVPSPRDRSEDRSLPIPPVVLGPVLVALLSDPIPPGAVPTDALRSAPIPPKPALVGVVGVDVEAGLEGC